MLSVLDISKEQDRNGYGCGFFYLYYCSRYICLCMFLDRCRRDNFRKTVNIFSFEQVSWGSLKMVFIGMYTEENLITEHEIPVFIVFILITHTIYCHRLPLYSTIWSKNNELWLLCDQQASHPTPICTCTWINDQSLNNSGLSDLPSNHELQKLTS